MTTVAEILDEAREYMHTHGFCKGLLDDSVGRVCTLGAIYKGFDYTQEKNGAVFNQHGRAARKYAQSVIVDKGWGNDIAKWNDSDETTQEDAEWVLETAAEKARIEGK